MNLQVYINSMIEYILKTPHKFHTSANQFLDIISTVFSTFYVGKDIGNTSSSICTLLKLKLFKYLYHLTFKHE